MAALCFTGGTQRKVNYTINRLELFEVVYAHKSKDWEARPSLPFAPYGVNMGCGDWEFDLIVAVWRLFEKRAHLR